jgi:hypothetical protein
VLLSGVRPVLAHNYAEGNMSLDQKLAEHHGAATRFSSLTLGCRERNLLSFTRPASKFPLLISAPLTALCFSKTPPKRKQARPKISNVTVASSMS